MGSVLKRRKRYSGIPIISISVRIGRSNIAALAGVSGRLYSVILEIREDKGEEYYHLVTLWIATSEEQMLYERTSKTKRSISAESIARLADNGSDVSLYFTNKGKMMPPQGNVGIDLNQNMLKELSEAARKLNVSRQTLIKRFIRRGLDQHHLAQKSPKAGWR